MINIIRIVRRSTGLLLVAGLVVWFSSIQAHAVQSFVETTTTGGQHAAVNTGMDAYDPRVLSITFSAAPPDEPGEASPESTGLAASDAPILTAEDYFSSQLSSSDAPPPPTMAETPSTGQTVQNPVAAPEPSSLALAVIGLAGTGLWLSQRRVRQK